MIKNCIRFQLYRILSTKKPKLRIRTQIPTLLIKLNVFLLLSAISASAWGQFFESPPRAIDDANEDNVFSPNGDGVQDNLIISFVTNGFTGDYRIMIDVHGPGAVGRPDGRFDIDDDWMVTGQVGPGPSEFYPENNPKIVHQEWDGLDRAPSQEAPPNARPVRNGRYEIRVETDAFDDGAIEVNNPTYQSTTLFAVVDIDAPLISSSFSHLFFSPNGDAAKESTTITYTLSEHLSKLSLEFADLEGQPPIELRQMTRGSQSFVWNGHDGLKTPLADGTYNLRLRGIDNGGNVTTFHAGAVQIDTEAPSFAQITPSQNAFLNTSVATVEVKFNPDDQGSPIDFDSLVTTIDLLDTGGESVSGITRSDIANSSLTLALDSPLDTILENGTYTAVILVTDEAGNKAEAETKFHFDTVPPTLTRLRSNLDDFRPSGSVNTEITFVEVDLDDNIDGGLNLAASTIALTGPNGAIFGNQTFGGDKTLRWTLRTPIATDGSEDGVYTITINAADRAGNSADFGEISFVYDTKAPRLISLTPNLEDNSFHLDGGAIVRSQPLSRITAGFDDGNGSGVDLASTRLDIFRSDDSGVGSILIGGTRHLNSTDGTLAFLLSQPLENQDGTQDGVYTIRVTSVDAAGNSATRQVDLVYDTETPTIVSVTPGQDAKVTTLSEVTVVMNDGTSGVDFGNTILKLIRDGIEISATSSNNGRDTAILRLSNPLMTDGSDDGEYRIEITTVDRAGNASDQIARRFFFVSRRPEIRLNAPAGKEVNELVTIEAQLFDYIGTGIDFSADKSSVIVRRPDGTILPSASVEADATNNRLIWTAENPLPRDGSADGEYGVSVNYEDFVGQNFTQGFTLTFDTQVPTVPQTTPTAGARVTELGTIVINFAVDLSGVDFSTVQVRLLDPNGTAVATSRSDNGVDAITLRVQELQGSTVEGIYVIEVASADRAGNIADSPFLSSFTYAPHEPHILIEPPQDLPTNQLNQISATLQDYVGPGIDFDSTETSISVRNTNGVVIASHPIQYDETESQLIWTALSPLPRDGSADGEYEVVSRFVESLGLGTTAPATFEQVSTLVFDTLPPVILSTSPMQNVRIGELNRATITLEDNLSGVDFDRTIARLLDSADNPVPTSTSNDGVKQISLSFDPFRTDGSADGAYRIEITPVDLAGNVGGVSSVEFVYVTQVPEIEMLTPTNESIVNRVPEVRVLIRDRSGEGIDLEKSTISVSDASGADVPGLLGDDGERTLTLRLGLPTDGSADGTYTVNLNLVDKVGVEVGYTRQFMYDSVAPTLVAESRPPRENIIDDNRIVVEFEVADTSPVPGAESGVDFDATTIQLHDANGEPIAGETRNDGVKLITFTSAELTSVGVYTLTVVVADRAGNAGVPQRFTYSDEIKPPRVISITPPAKSRVNHLTEISVVLEDQSGTGIDFSAAGSTIELRSPDGAVVGGVVTNDGADTMTLNLMDSLLTDGSDDGVYTISVQPIDRLGVNGDVRQFTITFDTQKPRIQSVSHIDMTQNVSHVKDPVRRIAAEFNETGSGIDYERSSIQLRRHREDGPVPVPGTPDNDGSLMWWQLDNPLTQSGADDGVYSVEIRAMDNAGNAEEKAFRLLYDTRVPVVSSIQASGVSGDTLELDTGGSLSVVKVPIHRIHLVFSDGSGSGLDVTHTTVQIINPNGVVVGATQQAYGPDGITLVFDSFKEDGSADGVYRLEITPVDLAGNVGGVSSVEFVYVTQVPEIEMLTPTNESIVNRVPEVRVLIRDRSGEGIDLEKSTISVSDASGADVPGLLGDDGERTLTLRLGLPTDGSADGTYTVNLNLVDKVGVEVGYTRQFMYDSVAPTLVAESRPPRENIIDDNRIVVEFEVADTSPVPGAESGVDFDATTIQLHDANGEPIAGETRNDGVKLITFTSAELTSVGVYTLTVVVADRAGNAGVPQRFTYSDEIKPPRVISITPPAKSRVNHLTEISVVLEDQSGTGIDFSAAGSTIELRSPDGAVVGGVVTNDGADTMTLNLMDPLLTDGSDDGVYTISVQPIDRLGVNGDVRQFTITFDTQKPRIQSVSHIDMTQNVSHVKDPVRRIAAEFNETGSGIDYERSSIQLRRHREDGPVPVPGTPDNDGSLMWWQLDNPLTQSGADDGVYSVEIRAMDNAGNVEEKAFRLLYDTRVPVVSSIQASGVSGDTLELDTGGSLSVVKVPIHRIHLVFSDGSGSGLDVTHTTVQIINPNGVVVGATQQAYGPDGITLVFDSFKEDGSADGVYRLEITPVDLAGNVGGVSSVEFVYVTQVPEIEMLTPTNESIVNRVPEVRVLIRDRSGEGIDLEKSTISVSDASGADVPGLLGDDGERTLTLRLGLPTDGSADGTYTVNLNLVDKVGVEVGYTRQFMYDSVAPTLVAESRPPRENIIDDNRIVVEFEVADTSPVPGAESGVDFDATTIQLHDANGEPIAGETRDDGVKLITFTSAELTSVGVYTLTVVVADRAGNAGVPQRFTYSDEIKPPRVISITPPAKSRVNHLTEISAVLEDQSGTGIDFSAAGSTIELRSPDGAVVGGVVTNDGADTMTLNLMDSLLTDGSDDGVYTISVQPIDRLGVNGDVRQFTITFDTQKPRIQSVSHIDMTQNVSHVKDPVRRIAAEFNETGSGIDYERSSIQLRRHREDGPVPVPGTPDNDGSLMWWQLDNPLTQSGADDGVYSVEIRAMDNAGNAEEKAFRLLYDTRVPVVSSIQASGVSGDTLELDTGGSLSVVKVPIHRIHLVFSDGSGSGLDVTHTTVQIINPNGVVVGATQQAYGPDGITLVFDSFKEDGSADGVYRLEITPVDLAGNVGGVSSVEFVYVTQVPEIEMLTPTNESIVNRVPEVRVLIRDRSGEGIDLEKSTISVSDASGADVPGLLGDDGERTLTLRLGLPTDGSADGTYTVNLNLVDKVGVEVGYTRQFMYDSVAPTLVAESRPPRENIIDDNRIVVEFEVADTSPVPGAESGVDFDATTIQLHDANGEPIAGETRNDGVKLITFTSAELTSVGVYTLTVVVADRAGNAGVPQRFTYSDEIKPPRVISITPPAKSRVNHLTEISVVLEDQSGTGIDFSAAGSTIELRSPDGAVVGGVVTNDGADTMTLNLMDSLLTDGSDDGVYTISVQPIDRLGVNGDVRQFTITFDTQKPRIQSVSHIDMTQNVSHVKDPVRRIAAEFNETGSGIDYERSSIQLRRHREDGPVPVPGTPDNDGSLMWWQLDTPLALNGSDDGTYSVEVKAMDDAGNAEETAFSFVYDTQVPVVSSIQATVVAGTALELDATGSAFTVVDAPIHQIHLVFSDGLGSGIDVSRTVVQLIRPNGIVVAATQQDNGVETVSLRFNSLRDDGTDDGRYLIQVTPIDLAGNTYVSPVEFRFIYTTQKPEIISTTPSEFTSVNQLDSVSAVLLDHSGEGIDFDRSTVGLHNSDGNLIDGRQRVDVESSAITWELDQPLSRDGVDDGEYSIRIVVTNKIGSELKSSKTFLYDTQIPRVVSVSVEAMPSTSIPVNELALISRSFAQMTVELSDEHPEGEQIPISGVDFVDTMVQLIGPNDVQKDITVADDGEAQLFVSFTPLIQPGAYTLEITPYDFAGNASGHPIQYNFNLDLAKPSVESVTIGEHIAPVDFINQLNRITAKLVDPNGVGLNLTSEGSTLSVIGPSGAVEGLQERNGTDELIWLPLHIPVDGTADGRYTVTVTPVDSLGLSGALARYEFVLDTQKPEIISAEPIDLTQAVSYIGEQVIQISAYVSDAGPAGLDLLAQTINLQASNGVLIPADLTSDGDSLILLTLVQPLATNGSDDGEYSVVINLGDRAGNTFEVEHTIAYDTQAPTLVETDPAGDLIRDDLTSIIADLSDLGGSGIDFTVSQLTLFDPTGNQVDGQLVNDGVGQLVLKLDELAEDGSYRIRVLAVDRAGNGANAPFDRTFLFSTNLPTVVATVPVTAPAESAFTRTPPNQVEVEFQSSPNLSTVKLTHPNGTTVPGQQIREGNRLIYRLSRELASDGSDDGGYTIVVTPVNSAGRSGEEQQFTFIYDTVLPEVEGILPVVESPGDNNALNEILALVKDATPSSVIDWDELDESWISFEKLGTGEKINGRVTSDRDELISFRLESPLASDGSQDGKYRVTVMPRDRAGNVAIPTALEFFLDTRPPIIHTDSLLINDRPLYVSTNHPDYPSADGSGSGVVIQAKMSDLGAEGEAGLGVDLSQSSIVVTAPDGTAVSGNLVQNGTDTIVFRSGPLIVKGYYRVVITSVGLDVDGLGFAPTGSITTQFLHETTEPVAELTDFGGRTSLTDEPLPLRGTATDPVSIEEEDGGTVAASGIAFVEIVGTGPDGEPIVPVSAVDESSAGSEPWTSWSLDFLPARSGGYNLDIRVTDRAGNVAIYDGVTVNLSVSLTYRGSTYSWPSPLRRSTGDRAHFSFDVNIPRGSKINMTLSIYDFAGDLVFEDTFSNISPGRDSDQLVTWNLKNQAGAAVARGVYIFRLEAEDIATKNLSNAVGKMLVIE